MKPAIELVKKLNYSCYLREQKDDDIFKMCKWFNDQEVLKYSIHRGKKLDIKEQRKYYIENKKSKSKIQFAICDHSDIFIGVVSAKIEKDNADISIVVGEKKYWGKGIATQAIDLIVDYCKKYHRINKFSAGCDIRNIGSLKSFKKNGFKEKKVEKQSIKYLDDKNLYDAVILECEI